MNVPPTIATAISSGKVTAADLRAMSLEDLHDLLEVITIDRHNQRIVDDYFEKNR